MLAVCGVPLLASCVAEAPASRWHAHNHAAVPAGRIPNMHPFCQLPVTVQQPKCAVPIICGLGWRCHVLASHLVGMHRSHHPESTASHQNCEVNLDWAASVLG